MFLTIFENTINEVRLTVRGEWLVVSGVAGANEDNKRLKINVERLTGQPLAAGLTCND